MQTSLFKFTRAHHILVSLLVASTILVASVALADIISGSSLTASSTNVTITNLTLPKPSDVVPGDVMIASIAIHDGNVVSVSAPAGWTPILRTDNDTNIGIASYWKAASVSEPANYTWSLSPQTRAEGGITRYSGVDTTNPIDTKVGNSGRGTVATTSPSTANAANEEVIALFALHVGGNNYAGAFFSTPIGMTEKYDSSNVAAGPTIASDDAIQALAGAVTVKSSNITGNQPRDWASQQIALRRASTPTIAFDNAINLDSINPVSSYTVPFMVSGSNPIIWMSVHDNSSNGGDHIASVTYNGVPLTRIESIISGCVNLTPGFLYMLVGPSLGTHDLTVTATTPIEIQGTVISYTGARQTAQPDAHTQNIAEFTGAGITTSLNTTADNSWVVSANFNWSLIPDPGIGVTTRTPKVNGWLGDSNGPVHPPGLYSMTWDTSHIVDACKEVVQASFAPAN